MRQTDPELLDVASGGEMAAAIAEARHENVHDDFDSALFVPSVILPAQTGSDSLWAHDLSGPIALMVAVLEDAARCIERGRRSHHHGVAKLAAEAEAWIRCDDREWPFAFASICDVLGLDVAAARAGLLGANKRHNGGNRSRAALLRIRRGPGRKRTLAAPRRAQSDVT